MNKLPTWIQRQIDGGLGGMCTGGKSRRGCLSRVVQPSRAPRQVYHSGVWGEASCYRMQDMMTLNLCHSGSFYKLETVILKGTLYNIHGA